MALISLRRLLDHAAENNYGLPAFNVNNMEQIHAILLVAHKVDSPANCRQFFAMPDIDGGLVGRCSLESEDFSKVCRISCQADYSNVNIANRN